MIENGNTEIHTQRVIRKPLHYEETQFSQKTPMESQTLAALAWYNYYLLLLGGERIKGPDIEDFNSRLKSNEDVERTKLYKTLMKQQGRTKNEEKEKLFFDELLIFKSYFQCMTMNCPATEEQSTASWRSRHDLLLSFARELQKTQTNHCVDDDNGASAPIQSRRTGFILLNQSNTRSSMDTSANEPRYYIEGLSQ